MFDKVGFKQRQNEIMSHHNFTSLLDSNIRNLDYQANSILWCKCKKIQMKLDYVDYTRRL
jgi:hypothetical protein